MYFMCNTPIILFYLCHIVIRLWLPPKHLVQLDNQAWLSGKLFTTKKTKSKKTTETKKKTKINKDKSSQPGMAVGKTFHSKDNEEKENK